jgi:hypothetical protein
MWVKFSDGLRPDPLDLKDVVKNLTAPQIFWVVRNGSAGLCPSISVIRNHLFIRRTHECIDTPCY